MRISTLSVVFQCALSALILTGCGGADKQDAAVEKQPETAAQIEQEAESATKVAEAKDEPVAANFDSHPGKMLHDANCISCHDAAVYTREDRKISDFPKLLAQVKRCDANLGSRLFDEEIEKVADYLNQAYYQYEN